MNVIDKMKEIVRAYDGTSRTLCVAEIDMIREAIRLIEKLEREKVTVVPSDGWISVEDELPSKSMSTIICTAGGAVCVARFSKEFGRWNSPAGRHARYWMPMPNAPKCMNE